MGRRAAGRGGRVPVQEKSPTVLFRLVTLCTISVFVGCALGI